MTATLDSALWGGEVLSSRGEVIYQPPHIEESGSHEMEDVEEVSQHLTTQIEEMLIHQESWSSPNGFVPVSTLHSAAVVSVEAVAKQWPC